MVWLWRRYLSMRIRTPFPLSKHLLQILEQDILLPDWIFERLLVLSHGALCFINTPTILPFQSVPIMEIALLSTPPGFPLVCSIRILVSRKVLL